MPVCGNVLIYPYLITLLSTFVLGYLFYRAYLFGFNRGFKAGEDASTIRLFRFKNPDVWEVAHALDHELQAERKTDSLPAIKNDDTTRKLVKK